jgi:hypothetical protein
MPLPDPTTSEPGDARPSKPPFTTLSRVLCVFALAATGGAMYGVLATDKMGAQMKLLACGGVLLVGILVIAAGAHFTDGRHRR